MSDVLDRQALARMLEMVGDDPEFLGELVDEYLADAPRQLDAMRSAAADGGGEALVRPAHTLKGTSANLGAEALAEVCREIEILARDGVAGPRVSERVAAADDAFADVAKALGAARADGWGS